MSPVRFLTIAFIISVSLAAAAYIAADTMAKGNKSPVPSPLAQTKCTFPDGSTVAVGRKAAGMVGKGLDFWQEGRYHATAFVVSERMQFAPLNGGLDVPAGSYTLFVDTSKTAPWTLIVSMKSAHWGEHYPGEQYDLGRTQLGADLLPASVPGFIVGCRQSSPTILWMESGTHAAYTKIWPWFPVK